jgi:phosphatidylglycerol---prolipoprotein diacylglyceryl transferase
MYALALLVSAATAVAVTDIPYFHLGALDIGIPIQAFGVIVAAGVIIGAIPLRRYAEWHGVSDDHIRGLLTWIMISGFLGAHEFDMLAYNWEKIGDTTIVPPASWWPLPEGMWPSNWPLALRIWDGISSYGGFIGGAIGFALFVWWKRLPARLFADITLIGLLLAFSIGRIGCTVVSDHIGAMVDPNAWYAFLAMDYPLHAVPREILTPELLNLINKPEGATAVVRAWNLGLLELLYLIPVNVVIARLAFRTSNRLPAGVIAVLTGVMYAPVRFFLDFLRPEKTDPRYLGLTFAQWSSIAAFGAALYLASRLLKSGKVAETVAPTSRDAQQRLRNLHSSGIAAEKQVEADKRAEAERKQAAIARARAERDREDEELAAAERAKADAARAAMAAEAVKAADARSAVPGTPATATGGSTSGGTNDEEDDESDDEPAASAAPVSATKSAGKPAGSKPAGNRPAGSKPAGSKAGAKKAKSRKR